MNAAGDPIPPERVFKALKAHHAKGLDILKQEQMDRHAYEDWRRMMALYVKAWPDAPTQWLRGLQRVDGTVIVSLPITTPKERRDRLASWLRTLGRALEELTLRLDEGLDQLNILIAHDGKNPYRDKLEAFIRALGADPVIVEAEPSLGDSIYHKVETAIPSCQFGVVLSTLARAASQDGHPILRSNLVDEAARLRSALGRPHVLVMVEEGVSLPSNIADLITARFTNQSMDTAFTELVKELRGLGLLKLGVAGQ